MKKGLKSAALILAVGAIAAGQAQALAVQTETPADKGAFAEFNNMEKFSGGGKIMLN